MSLKSLIDLSNRFKRYHDGLLPPDEAEEMRLRIEASKNASMNKINEMDAEIADRIAKREVSQELLRKTCTI